jgi:ketosteroid isomerase-like protein
MSQANVENLRAFLETWNQQPWTLEAVQRGEAIDMSFFDPDVTYEDTTLPDHVGETYHGHDGVLRATERLIEPWEWLRIELDEIVGAGDCLVSIHRIRARARHTGIEGEAPAAYLWTFRDGKVIDFRSFPDPEQAIVAAGIER